MKKHYNYLNIDLDKKIHTKLKAKQGDSKSRYILVNLISNSTYYDLSDCTVKIYGVKKDKTIFFNHATVTNAKQGQFEIELTTQALAVPGEIEIQILILGTTQERLTTFSFFIDVNKTIIDDAAIESTNEFTALTEALSSVQNIDNRFREVDEQFNTKANKNEVKIHFIKLNNFGESMLVQFENKNMLVDFGQAEDKDTILSYLNKYNINKLDYIIITHMHADHIGSLEYILNNINVSNCKAYLPCEPDFTRFNVNGDFFRNATSNIYNVISMKNIEKIFPTENQIFNLGEVSLKFNNCNLQYFEDYYNITHEYDETGATDYNNFSLVTTLIHEDVKVLLPSDINVIAQEKILNDVEKCHVYKTEHHSTNSLVSSNFINKINADISVCCNIDQQSIYYSQTSLYHFKNKKEYYVTYKAGDVVVCSNGNLAYVKTNNKRFEGENETYYNFQSVIENYSSETELIEVVQTLPTRTKLITTIDKGNKTCPDFISTYNATIEIHKITASRAVISIKDCDINKVKTYDGVWHSSKPNEIKWAKNNNSDIIQYYSSFNEIDATFSQTTTLISLVKLMNPNSKIEVDLTKGYASCPDFVSTYNATIEIHKITENRAILTIKDFDYNDIKVYNGVWHSANGDNIKWGNVLFEDSDRVLTFSSIGALTEYGVTSTSDALTVLKAMPIASMFSGNVTQTFSNLLSSYGGIATIEKITANVGRIILSDANSTLNKTWIGLWHRNNNDEIKWSLLTSTGI